VDFYPPGGKCEYCRIIQKSEKGLRLCFQDDRMAHEKAGKIGEIIFYHCYAGSTCIAVPVIFKGRHICTVLCGDVLSRKPSLESFRKIKRRLKNVDEDFEALQKAYFKMPVVSKDTIRVATELLSVIVSYVVNRESTILLQEKLNNKQQEIMNHLHSKDNLLNELKKEKKEIRKLRGRLKKGAAADLIPAIADEGTRNHRIAEEAMGFIDRYFMEEISLRDVAKHVGLSPNYFSHLFRKECGFTFIDYVIKKGIEKGCELLGDFRMNVTEVSMAVGYYNVNYFTQVFKRVAGMPPGKFRNRLQAG